MILGIDPKVGYAFKYLLGREATRPILIDVIDSVLDPAPGHRIQDLELLDPFNPKETADDKLSILDIKMWLYFCGTRPQWIQTPYRRRCGRIRWYRGQWRR